MQVKSYTVLVCKESSNSWRTQVEKLAYNYNTPILFQKNCLDRYTHNKGISEQLHKSCKGLL